MPVVSPLSVPAFSPFRLRDGRLLGVGPLTPAARPVIEAAMARLTPESSRRRFFTARFRLSDRELAQLTECDGVQRYALGASVVTPQGTVEGVGVARFVRAEDAPEVAEVAVLVVDAFQGQGVGRMLLRGLAQAALDRGITRLRGTVLTDNDPMLGLLRKHAPQARLLRSHDHYVIDVDLRTALGGGVH